MYKWCSQPQRMLASSFVPEKCVEGRGKNYSSLWLWTHLSLIACSLTPHLLTVSITLMKDSLVLAGSLLGSPSKQDARECKTKGSPLSVLSSQQAKPVSQTRRCMWVDQVASAVWWFYAVKEHLHTVTVTWMRHDCSFVIRQKSNVIYWLQEEGQNHETGATQEGILPLVHCWAEAEPVFSWC